MSNEDKILRNIIIGYFIFVTLCLILHYNYNKYYYIIDNNEFIKELKEISYNDKESAKKDHDKIQIDINNYINQNLSQNEYMAKRKYKTRYSGTDIFGNPRYTSGYQSYEEWKYEVQNKRRKEYIKTLTKNEQKLIKLFKRSNYTYNDYAYKRNIYALFGYIIIPLCFMPTGNNSPPLIFLIIPALLSN